MNIDHIALVANGEFHKSPALIKRISICKYIIAVDGGVKHLFECGITPDLIVGDLDSSPPDILERMTSVPQQIFPSEKDKTDLELAIDISLMHSPKSLHVFGGLGNRSDHNLYNVFLCARFPNKLFYETDKEQIFCLERSASLKCHVGQTISLIPLSDKVENVRTTGFKWELLDVTMDKQFMSLSNIALSPEVAVRFSSGNLLCCMQF